MKIKMLITSVGSLVSQNILDALEYKVFPRRDLVEVIGTNTIIETPNAYRCDRFYKVSATGSSHFLSDMERILLKENPDIIFTGRDEDAYVLYDLVHSLEAIQSVLPYGSKESLGIALDKLKTWEFTKKYGLPFAETFVLGMTGDKDDLDQFIDSVGYPIIGKPIEGYASKGVFYLRDRAEVHRVAAYEDYMLQEYLGDTDSLEAYFDLMDGPAPLFAHAPNVYHNSCHTIIGPDGSISPIFISRNQHDSGRTIGFKKVEIPDLLPYAMAYAEAMVSEGGAGPLTIQFRPASNGGYKVQEINIRCNGNTFPRLILGQDDIGLMINAFLPNAGFPVLPDELVGNTDDFISKSLFCNRMSSDIVIETRSSGYYQK